MVTVGGTHQSSKIKPQNPLADSPFAKVLLIENFQLYDNTLSSHQEWITYIRGTLGIYRLV